MMRNKVARVWHKVCNTMCRRTPLFLEINDHPSTDSASKTNDAGRHSQRLRRRRVFVPPYRRFWGQGNRNLRGDLPASRLGCRPPYSRVIRVIVARHGCDIALATLAAPSKAALLPFPIQKGNPLRPQYY